MSITFEVVWISISYISSFYVTVVEMCCMSLTMWSKPVLLQTMDSKLLLTCLLISQRFVS